MKVKPEDYTVKPEDDVGMHIRHLYWLLLSEVCGGPDGDKLFIAKRKKFTRDPLFKMMSKADPDDRAGRMITGLTGGSTNGVPTPMMWKRFIEGLVVLEFKYVELTAVMKMPGGESHIVRTSFYPRQELLNAWSLKKDPSLSKPASKCLSEFFADAKGTATYKMKHPLLKILWLFFAAAEIGHNKWNICSGLYVTDPKNCPALSNRRNDKRNNLQDAIRRTTSISWRRFVEALKAVAVEELECVFMFYPERGLPIEHEIVIDVSTVNFLSGERNE